MAIKYINIFKSKALNPNWDFWFEKKPSGNPDHNIVSQEKIITAGNWRKSRKIHRWKSSKISENRRKSVKIAENGDPNIDPRRKSSTLRSSSRPARDGRWARSCPLPSTAPWWSPSRWRKGWPSWSPLLELLCNAYKPFMADLGWYLKIFKEFILRSRVTAPALYKFTAQLHKYNYVNKFYSALT
jgi:hypothetical protein